MMNKLLAASVAILLLVIIASAAEAIPTNSLTVVVPRVDVAAAGETQTDPNLITWQTYDNFSESSLNTGLWYEMGGGEGTITTGPAGLTFTPLSLADPGRTNLGIQMTLPVTIGSYFAVRVPFLIANVATELPGFGGFNIDLCGPEQTSQCSSVAWDQGNDFLPPNSAPLSGRAFGSDDSQGVFSLQPTTVSEGQLAIIYKGDSFTNYVNDGTGWQQLGTFVRPADWAPLKFEMDAGNRVTVVPLPASLTLFGFGLAALGVPSKRMKA
ncbi:MAG: hypothetical protein WBK08_17800 [Nitrospira sp.]